MTTQGTLEEARARRIQKLKEDIASGLLLAVGFFLLLAPILAALLRL